MLTTRSRQVTFDPNMLSDEWLTDNKEVIRFNSRRNILRELLNGRKWATEFRTDNYDLVSPAQRIVFI